MATSWMKPLHVNKGKTVAQTITDRTDYAENPDKTWQYKYVTGYECAPRTVDTEFLLSKQQYADITGRNQGRHRLSIRPLCVSNRYANYANYDAET